MAELVLLPHSTHRRPPSPPQGRRPGQALNTIIEESDDATSPIKTTQLQRRMAKRRSRGEGDPDKNSLWFSPLSDHFPTPRGFHFLAAPILPSSPSTDSADEGTSPVSGSSNPSSNSWNRQSVMTDATEFDDIYDVSSDDDEPRIESMRRGQQSNTRQSPGRAIPKPSHDQVRRALPPLFIPNGGDTSPATWSGRPDFKKTMASPVPPTPPSAVAMSPAMFSYMQAQHSQEVPTISAPPSLDGSLSSDQMAAMSAPPTPIMGVEDGDETGDWSGVQLQPGALATLQALSTNEADGEYHAAPEQVIEAPHVPQEPMRETRPHPPRLVMNIARSSIILSPTQQRSLAGLTRLDIPSPGGFFSGLSPRARSTWHFGMSPAEEMPPPTSTTAEQFYRTPWNTEPAPPVPLPDLRPLHMANGDFSSSPVEQVVEVQDTVMEDLPTAVRMEQTPQPDTAKRIPPTRASTSSGSVVDPESPRSPKEEVVPTEIVVDYDPEYARKQQDVALSHLDRTELWLVAQRAYLKGVTGFEEPEPEPAAEKAEETIDVPKPKPEQEPVPPVPEKDNSALQRKKTVRFSDVVKKADIPRSLPSKLLRQESAYYRAFQDYIVRSMSYDVFVHRLPRFEALQAQRVSLCEAHRNQLLGKYQLSVVPQSAKKRMSANVARGDDVLFDDPEKLKADKEAEALHQMQMSTWHVAATKLLNGGRLIAAPVHKRLARMSRMVPGRNGVARDRARILDLGGQATCDWAWHAALQYPNTKIYTVTTKAIRQLSNSNIRGPPNHRQVAVERLAKLPFADDQFDLVSARELHSILKFVGEHGEDEWEACLRECMRVLKPGGYLEFGVMDSDVVNAGPLGLAKSVEFGFTLKTLGYDPSPTRLFLGRLHRAGFEEVRRAWTVLPMGPRPAARRPPARDSAGAPVQTLELEAMVTGSADGAAAVTGLAASWSWERWLLRCEMEKASGELRLADMVSAGGEAAREAGKSLDGVHAVVEEGRRRQAGFRVLRGHARKPRPGMGTINLVLDF
ncbi:Methyltransferase domain-containing protein [Pleurostoma richardsiae]|uniref:Methyltransferase domain-containing protein n=1 Tax=Pleurostoma richardsiae TaxID=41990 RepID=A0AA38RW18_9PEZI|nr:Methyltransferase domain-containing protein [Pleurostoma richardsiae]